MTSLSMSIHRASTSGIINHHTQSDDPSVPATKVLNLGEESAVYAKTPNTATAGENIKLTAGSGKTHMSFVSKFDKDGRVYWARAIGAASATVLGEASAAAVSLTANTAIGDKVFVSGTFKIATLNIQTCQFASAIGP